MTPRPPGRGPFLLVAAAFLGLTLGAACRRQATVATALEVAGIAERASGGGAWSAALPGTTFAIGDTLRTGTASRARLGLPGGGVIRVGENARLRFQRGALVGQQAPDIAVDLGSAEVEEPASELSIVTLLGPARVERGARVRVRDVDVRGHMRTPGYVKGKVGRVAHVHGAFRNPETLAYGGDGLPEQPLYLVGFAQRDLWPDYRGRDEDRLYVDVFEHWLQEER